LDKDFGVQKIPEAFVHLFDGFMNFFSCVHLSGLQHSFQPEKNIRKMVEQPKSGNWNNQGLSPIG
jgi:hypothetical protein